MPDKSPNPPRPHTGRAIWRGVCHLCPACGKGRLFTAYLKQVSQCAVCGEDFTHIQAEDGPSWLTILLLGPVFVPLTLIVSFLGLPIIVVLSVAVITVIGGVLLALPRVKGGFIGALWALGIRSGDR